MTSAVVLLVRTNILLLKKDKNKMKIKRLATSYFHPTGIFNIKNSQDVQKTLDFISRKERTLINFPVVGNECHCEISNKGQTLQSQYKLNLNQSKQQKESTIFTLSAFWDHHAHRNTVTYNQSSGTSSSNPFFLTVSNQVVKNLDSQWNKLSKKLQNKI